MDDATVLGVDNLTVTLDHLQVLRNISININRGEAIAGIRPNGAG